LVGRGLRATLARPCLEPTGAPIEDVVGSAGISIPNLPAVLLAILTAHRNADMD
jgi:hypothetical protein